MGAVKAFFVTLLAFAILGGVLLAYDGEDARPAESTGAAPGPGDALQPGGATREIEDNRTANATANATATQRASPATAEDRAPLRSQG